MRLTLVVCLLLSLASFSSASAQNPPSIGILSPHWGSTIAGPSVTVEAVVTDFTLVPPTGTDATPGRGHIIYYLDIEPDFAPAPGQSAIPTDPNAVYAASDKLTHTFQHVAAGAHAITVLLVYDNHTPAMPFAIDMVNFTVTVAPAETPTAKPRPTSTQAAPSASPNRSDTPSPVSNQEATATLTPPSGEPSTPARTSSPSPTPAVLAAELPNGGDIPAEGSEAAAGSEVTAGSGGPSNAWLFVIAAAGLIATLGAGAAIARRLRR